MSPVLLALYFSSVIKVFTVWACNLNCKILSYIDDGTLIVQSKNWATNLCVLKEAYRLMFYTLTSFGFAIEHDKLEIFHFLQKHNDANPPLNLGFSPFTRDTSLYPKTYWRYLGFYFD